MRRSLRVIVSGAAVVLFPLTVISQSLTDKLSEDESFYKNYGREPYTKLKIEKDVTGLYDLFGVHITDGVQMYELGHSRYRVSNSFLGVEDSTVYSRSNEMQKNDFFEKFSNLVLTQDAIGGNKMSFLVGDQITTRFTPLTFNKTNYNGMRFDFWSTGLQMSLLLSRTRPGFLSKKWTSGTAPVEYPLSPSEFPPEFYDNRLQGGEFGAGISGWSDFSNRSPFNDIDWLWALHAQNNIANKVDVGVTVINHHVTNVKSGEKWIKGEIPEGWMPNHIHFEFFDATPQRIDDPGVYVQDVVMLVNGEEAVPYDGFSNVFRTVYVGTVDSVLLPKALPLARPQSGHSPVIVEFATNPKFYYSKRTRSPIVKDVKDIRSIKFRYTVAGNYLVFVSTSRQIPLAIRGVQDPQDKTVEYTYIDRAVSDIYRGVQGNPTKIYAGRGAHPSNEDFFSTTYFGEYIAMSPKLIPSSGGPDFIAACADSGRLLPAQRTRFNYRTLEYTYSLNSSTVTYGVNLKGELGGVKFSGEFALNRRESMLPNVGGQRDMVNRIVGTVKAERALGRNLGVDGEAYYIAPDWQTNLVNLQPSRYFKETRYKMQGLDYLSYPSPLSNNWQSIDDNDDNDAFVESDRRRYPSDMSVDAQKDFFADGKYRAPKLLELPTGMLKTYDDPDGVISSKDDRNKNGRPDYLEDFLLFSSDPPQFELGIDLNNNGVPDYEDDDILPDFGYSVGNYITSNGVKTQGIGGAGLNLRYTPSSTLVMDCGLRWETILDHDLDGVADNVDEIQNSGRDFWVGKSMVGYLTATKDVVKRSQGIQFKVGAEVRGIQDAIRNDVVRSIGFNANGIYNVYYYYYIDPLNFRRALVANLTGTVIYNNIPNFEYTFRAKAGGQQRIGIADSFATEYTFYDPASARPLYELQWEPYPQRSIGDLHFVNKLSYKIGFKYDNDDWRRAFSFLNRLEITPQYKVGYSISREFLGPTREDPRNFAENLRRDISGPDGFPDGKIDSLYDNVRDNLSLASKARIYAEQYRANNNDELVNVPILRATYRIAENTRLELGIQSLRFMDLISLENSRSELTFLAQVVSRYNYKGYNVTFFIGSITKDSRPDILSRDPVLGSGDRHSFHSQTFFAQLFSGI